MKFNKIYGLEKDYRKKINIKSSIINHSAEPDWIERGNNQAMS